MKHNYKLWTELPYAGESSPPTNPEQPFAGSWPMYYLKRSSHGGFETLNGKPIKLAIKNPNEINWNHQLKIVQNIQKMLTPQQIAIAKYWGTGAATKQWAPIIDRLIDTYGLTAAKAARVLAAVHAGINDILVVAWYLKFKWQAARPNQLDHNLATVLCTPRHSTYPAGHSVVAGCASTILSYFFPPEKERLIDLAEQCSLSRLYSGLHFWIDCTEGLRLGRQVGRIVVDKLKKQKDSTGAPIDIPVMTNLHAVMPPPPYTQMIPFNFVKKCTSLVRPTSN